mmetsp:Transcript_7685/g.15236  ORF Transcript_7685/g.15236 Transcript_7685/m.15236 type:complete len:255 (-) Transcript_7685:121-885(-)
MVPHVPIPCSDICPGRTKRRWCLRRKPWLTLNSRSVQLATAMGSDIPCSAGTSFRSLLIIDNRVPCLTPSTWILAASKSAFVATTFTAAVPVVFLLALAFGAFAFVVAPVEAVAPVPKKSDADFAPVAVFCFLAAGFLAVDLGFSVLPLVALGRFGVGVDFAAAAPFLEFFFVGSAISISLSKSLLDPPMPPSSILKSSSSSLSLAAAFLRFLGVLAGFAGFLRADDGFVLFLGSSPKSSSSSPSLSPLRPSSR